ncbi:hypothetical protein IEI_03002 [Bacillus wiedmannii]|uniref:hypothetical protein n=1 Tax=Bacillus wiedmannii TaxID=1890302 RepID=UPI0002789C5A|nr:hypothetical protein [Bacillus wiedmannii]EJQ50050.1 hypothetical protein IEI_03002 [Bacillus wiedmannii]
MKYNYEFIVGPYDTLLIKLPSEISIVADFLASDIQGGTAEPWITEIDQVLNGKEESSKFGGNACDLEIKPDFTHISNRYIEDEDYSCTIETSELRELILIWEAKNLKYEK